MAQTEPEYSVIGLVVEKDAFDVKRLLQRFDGKITVLDAEPIIDDQTWIEAQRLRKRKATNIDHTIRNLRGDGPELLTGGLGICAVCGKGITINRKTEKMKHSHYKCYNRGGFDADRNPIPKCSRCYKPIKAEELDRNIIQKLKEFFNSKDIIEDIINRDKRSRQNMHDEIENEIKSLEKQQVKVEREIENITNIVTSIDSLTNNPTLIGNYIKKQEQLISQLDGIARQVTKLKVIPIERTDDDYTKDELLASVDSFAELFDYATEAEKKILVHYLVNKVTVESVDKFKIELRFFEEFPNETYLQELQNSEDTPQGIKVLFC